MDTLVIEVNCRPDGHDGPPQLGITVEAPYSVASQQRQSKQRLSKTASEYRNHDYQNYHSPDLNSAKQPQVKSNHLNHNGSNNLHSRAPSTTPSSPLSSINRHHIGSIGEQIQRGLQITQIQAGSVIDKTGQFKIGDIIVEVNGVNLQRPTFQETHKILREYVKQSSHGPPLQLKVLRRISSSSSSLPSTTCSQTTVIERSVDPPTTTSPKISNSAPRKSDLKPVPSVSPQSTDVPRHLVEGYNTRRLGTKHRIRLTKSKDGFGIKIAERDNMFGANRPIYITAITTTGSAYRDGNLKEGDMLLEVNGIDLSRKTQPEVTRMLKAVGVNEAVEFVVSRQDSLQHHDYHNLDDILPLGVKANVEKVENSCDNDKSLIDLEPSDQHASVIDARLKKKDSRALIAPVKIDGPGTYIYDIPLNDTKSAGLGLYLKYPALYGKDLGIWIEKVITGGAAWKDGRLLPDDQILAINGINLMGLSNAEASETLRAAVCRGIGPEATSNTIRLNIHRRDPTVVAKILHGTNTTIEHSDRNLSNGHSKSYSISSPPTINNTQDSYRTALESSLKHNRSHSSNNTSSSSRSSNLNSQNDSVLSPQTQASISLRLIDSCNDKSNSSSDKTNDTTSAISQITDFTSVPINDRTSQTGELTAQDNQSVLTQPKSLDHPTNAQQEEGQASGSQSWDEESLDNSTGEERFQRDGFGRRSISEKRHAQLMAKNTDTFRRNQKAREAKARQRQLAEQLERQHISDETHRRSLTVMPPTQSQVTLNHSLTPIDMSSIYVMQDQVGLSRNLPDRRSLGHRRDSFRAAVDRSYESSMAEQVGVYCTGSEYVHQYQHRDQSHHQYNHQQQHLHSLPYTYPQPIQQPSLTSSENYSSCMNFSSPQQQHHMTVPRFGDQ